MIRPFGIGSDGVFELPRARKDPFCTTEFLSHKATSHVRFIPGARKTAATKPVASQAVRVFITTMLEGADSVTLLALKAVDDIR